MKQRPIRTGDLFFYTKTKGVLSKRIKWFTRQEQYHIGIITGIEENGYYKTFESQYGFPTGGAKESRTHHVWLQEVAEMGYVFNTLSKKQRDTLRALINKYNGRPYDYRDILLLALKRFIPSIQLKRSSEAVICSELVKLVYKDMGVDLTPKIKVPTPGDIARSTKVTLYDVPQTY